MILVHGEVPFRHLSLHLHLLAVANDLQKPLCPILPTDVRVFLGQARARFPGSSIGRAAVWRGTGRGHCMDHRRRRPSSNVVWSVCAVELQRGQLGILHPQPSRSTHHALGPYMPTSTCVVGPLHSGQTSGSDAAGCIVLTNSGGNRWRLMGSATKNDLLGCVRTSASGHFGRMSRPSWNFDGGPMLI